MIESLYGNDINLHRIEFIGPGSFTDENDPYFTIYFKSGHKLLIKGEDRAKLVQMWKDIQYTGPIITPYIRK